MRAIASCNLLTVVLVSGIAALTADLPGCPRQPPPDPGVGTATIEVGALSVEFRDNADSPQLLSGVDRLFHTGHAPGFDAFDPHDPGSSAGLNFEHIISGHSDPANWFAPRNGPYRLYQTTDLRSVLLVRREQEDPWRLESSMRYTVTPPHYIDFAFNCRPHDVQRFGERGYAVLFWADYMNDVADVALHFRGLYGPDEPEQWVSADAPTGHPDYFGGGTYRHAVAPALEYDADHNLKLNLWSYDYPRYTQPFYYGLAEHGMCLMLMFDRAWTERDEIRFSLFKFKVGDEVRRPAWDFQYVIHQVAEGQTYGFRGRLVWKPFVSADDCRREYEAWAGALPPYHAEVEQPPASWRDPPTTPVTRENPRLLNYFHMQLPEGQIAQKAARLAQWNVLVLNHDIVVRERLSLESLRATNPQIKILAWVPLQSPHRGLSAGLSAAAEDAWRSRRVDGTPVVAPWGGKLLSPYTEAFAWPRHVLDYVARQCLTPGGYDGVMLDCLWETEPEGQDVNGDGVCDERDTDAWQQGMLFLLQRLRTQFPEAIVVGNGGVPWSDACPYYEFANGCMHENSLGDQFGGTDWAPLWDGYRRTLAKAEAAGRAPYHLIAVDVRAAGRTPAQAAAVTQLTDDDRRRVRLGLATSLLLDGGYFGFDRGDCLHGQLWWLPEYDLDLGLPSGPHDVGRYGPGLYSRSFERGMVIVNPAACDVVVSLESPLWDVVHQLPVTDLIVPARDARILVKED